MARQDRSVEVTGDYWEAFFEHLEKFAQDGDFERAKKMVEANLQIDSKELISEDPRVLRLPTSIAAGLNHLLAVAYWKAEGFEAAYAHLKKAWEILSDDSYTHPDKLLQQLPVIDLLAKIAPIVDYPQINHYAKLRVEIHQQLGLSTHSAKRYQESSQYATKALSRLEHVSMERLPPKLAGLSKEILKEFEHLARNHPERKPGIYGSEFVDFQVSQGIIRIFTVINPQNQSKLISVSLNPETSIDDAFWGINASLLGVNAVLWDKRLTLEEVLKIVRENS